MNIATAVLLQHANDIKTELVNDLKLSEYRSDILIISEKFQTLNKRLNRTYNQRYSDTVNNISDLTLQQVREARIISLQYLVSKIKYECLEQAAKSIQLFVFVNDALELYKSTKNDGKFTNDIQAIIEATQRFLTKYDCQLNRDEVLTDIEICQPIYRKMYKIIFDEIKKNN